MLKHFPKTLKQYSPEIAFIAETIGSKKVEELEKIGTALFMIKKFPEKPDKERACSIHKIKPHILLTEAQEALRQAQEIINSAEEMFK